ncbi:MAG: PBECR2 nuclease fold domain-containing protein [Clostridia bacterium]
MNKKIATISKEVIDTLKMDIEENIPILIGDANIEHMKINHLEDYNKYGNKISDIINNPTYLARNEGKNSIEYIKRYVLYNEMVLVVVRTSGKGKYFVRTMYVMAKEKIEKYEKYGYFIEIKK